MSLSFVFKKGGAHHEHAQHDWDDERPAVAPGTGCLDIGLDESTQGEKDGEVTQPKE
jgi:hypothetical protein